MTLVEYDFYKNEYGGSVVGDESSFKKTTRRAEIFLNRLTFNRIVAVNSIPGQMIGREFEAFTDTELEMLKFGLCNLIDTMQRLSTAEEQALAGNVSNDNVKSRSSGGESISYESRKTVYDGALADEAKKIRLFRNALMEYIQPEAFKRNPFCAGSW